MTRGVSQFPWRTLSPVSSNESFHATYSRFARVSETDIGKDSSPAEEERMTFNSLFRLGRHIPWLDVVNTLVSFFGLRDYLEYYYDEITERKRTRTIYAFRNGSGIQGDGHFWRDVTFGHLRVGDRIKLLGFQVSPWFPRKPGVFWTNIARSAREKALISHVENNEGGEIVFDLYGKNLMAELGGIGSVNLRKDRDVVLFTATASGNTDEGIPIRCDQSVWKKISGALRKDGMVEVDITGTLTNLPLQYDSYLLRTHGLPKVAIQVDSTVQLETKVSAVPIIVHPWTLFRTSREHEPYGFTYDRLNLRDGDYSKAVRWLVRYAEKHEGTTLLTDFDEELNSLKAQFPLSHCIDGSVTRGDIMDFCQEIHRNFQWDF